MIRATSTTTGMLLFALLGVAAIGNARPAAAATRSDIAFRLAQSSAISVTIGGTTTPVHLTKNTVASFETSNAACVVSPQQPSCSVTLGLFLAKLDTFTTVGSSGTFTVTNPSIGIGGPLTLVDTGSGFVLPSGTLASANGTLTGTFADGTQVTTGFFEGLNPLSGSLTFHLSGSTQTFSLNATLPFSVNVEGHTIQGTVALALTGQAPFLNVAPVARAGGDRSIACGGQTTQVTLNGSQSTDADNNITSFTWLLNGAVLAQGAVATVSLPLGVSVITLQVRDALGGLGVDTTTINVELGNNRNCCPPGTNIIVGTSNNDTLIGTAGRDCILGLGGQDVIFGNGGNDVISGGDGDDVIHGGDGDDLLSGGTGQDQLFGENGNDALSGGDGDDRLDGGAGNDVLFGGQGQDQLTCGPGTNSAFGDDGDDTLTGGPGNDVLNGGADHNICVGGGGTDQFILCGTIR